ncbi:MAG: hypothetical protein ACR2OZ_04750 [Verrucomicrobiales bacterium]
MLPKFFLLAWVSTLFLPAFDTIPASRFESLQSLIKPKPEEASWTNIPWMTGLWEARKKAAAEGKPILLWEMDGHPLGCT